MHKRLREETRIIGGNIDKYCITYEVNGQKAEIKYISNWIWNVKELLKNEKKYQKKVNIRNFFVVEKK